ncbi:hypothetical protein MRB53_041628 [Persea americana]|nr:hypothetical protein MRB53_041628 [Persea americana]
MTTYPHILDSLTKELFVDGSLLRSLVICFTSIALLIFLLLRWQKSHKSGTTIRESKIPSSIPSTDKVYTPAEKSALGPWPDYAALTSVPLPRPAETFEISKALPRPYRTFRYPYHQTLALFRLEPDYYLELESTYVRRIAQRQQLVRDHGELVSKALPGSEDACREAMQMSVDFLCARYPMYFRVDAGKETLHNGILGTTSDLENEQPLMVLLNNVPEDFVIMMERDDEQYYFVAGEST